LCAFTRIAIGQPEMNSDTTRDKDCYPTHLTTKNGDRCS
jgi:hypothetical protein